METLQGTEVASTAKSVDAAPINTKIGRSTLKGRNFDISVEVGARAMIRCFAVHDTDVAIWAMSTFDKGRPGQAKVLYEMQVNPGEFTLEQIMENWFVDMETYGDPDFQKELLRVVCDITGAKYKDMLDQLEANEAATQKKAEAEAEA